MARVARILAAPDLHCWATTYNRVLPDGTQSRAAEWKQAARVLVGVAREREVDLVIFPGDLFCNARPAPAQLLAVHTLLKDLSQAGISWVAMPGNHDLAGAGQPGPVNLLEAMWSMEAAGTVFLAPDWVCRAPGLAVVALPSLRPSELIASCADPAEAAFLLSQRLIEVARRLRAECPRGYQVVLVGHWAVQGATAAGGDLPLTEPVLPLGDLLGLECDAYVFGHIHKPQVLHEWPPVVHTGSLQRLDFGDAGRPVGCYLIDLDARSTEFVELPARRFVTIDWEPDWDHPALSPEEQFAANLVPDEVRDAIVRVRYRATEDQARRVNADLLIEALEEYGPHFIAGIYPEILRADRARDAGVRETTGPLEALERWLALRPDVGPDTREAVLREAGALLREVAMV